MMGALHTGDHTYQNTPARLKAPEGTLCVDLVSELPFHEDTLSILFQHGHSDGATAKGHRDLRTQQEKIILLVKVGATAFQLCVGSPSISVISEGSHSNLVHIPSNLHNT